MENFTDLYTDFDEHVDVFSDDYFINEIKFNELGNKNTNDIRLEQKKIDLSGIKVPKVLKNKTNNFDIQKNKKKIKDIYLVKTKKLTNVFLKFKKTKDIYGAKPKNVGNNFLKIKKIKNVFSNKMFFRKSFFKKLFIFFFIFFIFYIILGIILQSFIRSGYNNILSLANNKTSIHELNEKSIKIKFDFVVADFLFKPFLLIPNKNIKDIYYIIKGGKSLSFLIYDVNKYYTNLNTKINFKSLDTIKLTDIFKDSKNDFSNFANKIHNTLYYYNKIGIIFNKDFQNNFDYAKSQLHFGYNLLTTINRNFDTFINFFGEKEEKKYLVLFQNNDEIRPTGGFMGSMGIITVYKGQIKNFEKADVYEYEWEINKVYSQVIPSPEGINKITSKLGLRDANYEIDFLESSKQIKFFTDKINQDIDGIIYMNQNIVLDFLKATGDIYFETLGQNIGEENFSQIFSTIIEAKTFKVGTLGSPKEILFEFTDLFIKTLNEKKLYNKYVKILYDNINSRDIVITSFNTGENSLLWKLGLTGTINYSKSLDYSYPVFTSIGGGKTDRYMNRNYIKKININPDCSINTSLNISQTHLFTQAKEDEQIKLMNKYNITDNNILFIQGKTSNKQFVQVVLPKDAIIKKSDFFNIINNNNSKIVQFYTTTRRLESINHTIEYTLLNKECHNYNFKFYKQPGIRDYDLIIKNGINNFNNKGLKSDYYYYGVK